MSRFARENPEDWNGEWDSMVDRADNMRKRAREEGVPPTPTPASQERTAPTPTPAEQSSSAVKALP